MDNISYSLAAKSLKKSIATEAVLPTKANLDGLSIIVPSGTVAERPTLEATTRGLMFNTDNGGLEEWTGTEWKNVSANISAVSLKGTDTEANILALSGMVTEDLWIASDTLDGWVYDGASWINIGPLKGDTGIQGVQGIPGDAITMTSIVDNLNGTYTWTFSDTTEFTTSNLTGPTGPIGLTGDTGAVGGIGNGISTIIRTTGTGLAGETDIYTVTYTDATTSTLEVTNGADGGTVDHVSRTVGDGAPGTTDIYTMWGDVGETNSMGTFDVYNGADGGGAINDTTITDTTLWSSDKINNEILAMSIALG